MAVFFYRLFKETDFAKYAAYCFSFALSCLLIAAISITGSFGGFQSGFQRNVTESNQYSAAHADLEIKQEVAKNLAKGMSDPETYLVANKEYKEAQAEAQLAKTNLDNLMSSGAGEGNAVFQSYASMWGVSAEKVAERGNLVVATILELVMLLLFLVSATELPESNNGSGHPKPKTQNGIRPKSKKKPKTANLGTKTGAENGQPKLTSLQAANSAIQSKKRQRILALEEYLDSNPDASMQDRAEFLGVSRETARTYSNELGKRSRTPAKTVKFSKR